MRKLYRQLEFNSQPGPYYEDESALPADVPEPSPVHCIAYYLPQFHAIPENDAWWGKGFTEWTNVTKAWPRYVGHYQPRLPGPLGFYNLADEAVLRSQAALAKRAGIYGFCIHNYWFSGKTLLGRPLEILLRNPDIDLNFCLNWANETWSRRWVSSEDDVLIKQRYDPGDDVRYAASILNAVQDPRYIRVAGRPLIMLYRPSVAPDARAIVDGWRNFFVKEGAGDPFVVMAQGFGDEDPGKYGMDAAAGFPPHRSGWKLPNHRDRVALLDPDFDGHVASYEAMMRQALANRPTGFRLFPGVCPQWDNEARRPGRGFSFYGSTPGRYGDWLRAASQLAMAAPQADERIVFVNAWNEWAEGAYLEPDRHHGFAYLAETRRVLASLSADRPRPRLEVNSSRYAAPTLSLGRLVMARARRAVAGAAGRMVPGRSSAGAANQGRFLRRLVSRLPK